MRYTLTAMRYILTQHSPIMVAVLAAFALASCKDDGAESGGSSEPIASAETPSSGEDDNAEFDESPASSATSMGETVDAGTSPSAGGSNIISMDAAATSAQPGAGGAGGQPPDLPGIDVDAGPVELPPLPTGDDAGVSNELCGGENEFTWAPGNRCYRISLEVKTWAQAAADCVRWSDGLGHLASITTAEEDAFLTPYSVQGVWLGGTDARQEGSFQWLSNEVWLYENFGAGEPNNYFNSEHCLQKRRTGVWNDSACNSEFGYICERQLTPVEADTMDQAP